MRGGVGVSMRGNAAVGESESTITYSGRNRNAPDLRRRKGKRKKKSSGPRRSSRNTRGGEATSDVSQLEDVFRPDPMHGDKSQQSRIFNVRHLSDAAREIAIRVGYPPDKIFIEQTDDDLTSVVIPPRQSYSDFLAAQAAAINWVFKPDGKEFRFHPRRWEKDRKKVKEVFDYGAGADILSLQIDGDFRLPLPRTVKVSAYVPERRNVFVFQASADNNAVDSIGSLAILGDQSIVGVGPHRRSEGGASRRAYLSSDEESIIAPGGRIKLASQKAQNLFIQRNLRALKLNVALTGNPSLEGGDIIGIRGTGTPLVDNAWYIEVARHIFDGDTYQTSLDLRRPPTGKGKGEIQHLNRFIFQKGSKAVGSAAFQGTKSDLAEYLNKSRGAVKFKSTTPGRQ
jgi:hypothetical protein